MLSKWNASTEFRNPLFRRPRFAGKVTIVRVRRYLWFKLSSRDMGRNRKGAGCVGGAEHDPALGVRTRKASVNTAPAGAQNCTRSKSRVEATYKLNFFDTNR
jgi:hypothetical protein